MQAQGEDDEAIAEQPLQVTCGHQVSTGYSTVQYSTVQGQEVTAVVLTAEYSKHVEDFYYINLSRLFHTKVAFKLLRTLLKSHKHVYGYNCMRILSGFGLYLATSLSLSASNN